MVDNYREHILDGFVIDTEDGLRFVDAPEVARTAERGVTLTIEARRSPTAAAGVGRRDLQRQCRPDGWRVCSAEPGSAISRERRGTEPPMEAEARVEFSVPARADNVPLIRHALAGLAEALEMEPSEVADLKTVVTEACMNVVVHAYGEGEAGVLEVDAWPEEDAWWSASATTAPESGRWPTSSTAACASDCR